MHTTAKTLLHCVKGAQKWGVACTPTTGTRAATSGSRFYDWVQAESARASTANPQPLDSTAVPQQGESTDSRHANTQQTTATAKQQISLPRTSLVPFSNSPQQQQQQGHPSLAWRSKAALCLEVFSAFRKFGQTHHRLFFLMAERLSYDDLYCQSPARIAGLAEAAHALEALEVGMLTLLRRVAWRRKHEFGFEHFSTVMWAISKVKASTPEAQAELDLMARDWTHSAINWLDGVQQSQKQAKAQSSISEPNPKHQRRERGYWAKDGSGGLGQPEGEAQLLVRILETVGSLAAVQYRPQGTLPQPKALVHSVAGSPIRRPHQQGSSLAFLETKAAMTQQQESMLRGAFEPHLSPRTAAYCVQPTNGLCLTELKQVHMHDTRKQEVLDNMQKILSKKPLKSLGATSAALQRILMLSAK